MMDNVPALLTVREAAEELFGAYSSNTRKRIYQMIENDQIEGLRIGNGRTIFIPRRCVEGLRGDV